jgi:hypothetical protein
MLTIVDTFSRFSPALGVPIDVGIAGGVCGLLGLVLAQGHKIH